LHYVRIYADQEGETHFEEVTLEVQARPSSDSSDPGELASPIPVQAAIFRRVVGDQPPEPHVAPHRQFVIHLAGETEIEVSDGEVRRFGAGAVVLAEDVTGKGHITRRIGDTPHETLFVRLEHDVDDG
jgi:hypothetical protein